MGLSKLSPSVCPKSPAIHALPNWLLENVFVVIFYVVKAQSCSPSPYFHEGIAEYFCLWLLLVP